MPVTEYKRINYLKHEAEIAHRNAQAADTMGRYAEASWWEAREAELWKDIENEQNSRESKDSDINISS